MRSPRLTHGLIMLALAGLATGPDITAASAADPVRPVILELFTSQGCSSCPPADALLREFSASRADVLPLAFHVTYWNDLGWRDPFSFDGATERQRLYARRLGEGSVYTPQLVVDGTAETVGSDRTGAETAIRRAQAVLTNGADVSIGRAGDEIAIAIGAGRGRGTVYVVSYDSEHRTPIGRGENGGRTLLEANIVRSFVAVADWTGAPVSLRQKRPQGEHVAVFVQAADGRILGAAREARNAS